MHSTLAFTLLVFVASMASFPSADATLSHLPASLADSLRSIGFGGGSDDDDIIVVDAPSVLPPPRNKFLPRPPRPENIVITDELIESVVGEENVDLLRTFDGGDDASLIQLLLTEDDMDFQRKLEELVVPVSDMSTDQVVIAEENEASEQEQEDAAATSAEEEENMNGKLNMMGKMEMMKKNMDVMMGDEPAEEEMEEVNADEEEVSPMDDKMDDKMDDMIMEEEEGMVSVEDSSAEEEPEVVSEEETFEVVGEEDPTGVVEEPTAVSDEDPSVVSEEKALVMDEEDLIVVLPSDDKMEEMEITLDPDQEVEEEEENLMVVLPMTEGEEVAPVVSEEEDVVSRSDVETDAEQPPVVVPQPSGSGIFGFFKSVIG